MRVISVSCWGRTRYLDNKNIHNNNICFSKVNVIIIIVNIFCPTTTTCKGSGTAVCSCSVRSITMRSLRRNLPNLHDIILSHGFICWFFPPGWPLWAKARHPRWGWPSTLVIEMIEICSNLWYNCLCHGLNLQRRGGLSSKLSQECWKCYKAMKSSTKFTLVRDQTKSLHNFLRLWNCYYSRSITGTYACYM